MFRILVYSLKWKLWDVAQKLFHTYLSTGLLIFISRFDAHLSEKGVKEAENGGQALKEAGYKFDVAHTSLLTRAQVTLSKVLNAIDQPDLKIEKTWRLNERHYGALTGNLMVYTFECSF